MFSPKNNVMSKWPLGNGYFFTNISKKQWGYKIVNFFKIQLEVENFKKMIL